MRIFEYQRLAMRTCGIPYEDRFNKLVHGVTGLVSELIEVKKADDSREHLIKELGDCTWMIAEICDSHDLDFMQVFIEAPAYAYTDMDTGIMNLCSIVQKKYQGHEVDPQKIFCNLCVIMANLQKILMSNKVNLIDVLEMNIEKLKARFPDGFDPEKSLNRKEGDI